MVLHKDEDPLVRKEMERLHEHRLGQIKDEKRVKILEYADEPDWKAWLAKHGVGVGNVFPQKVPYYLLLVGGPERIPFEFGQFLSLEYTVGLLHFDSVDGYRQYVDSLIAYEIVGARRDARKRSFSARRRSSTANPAQRHQSRAAAGRRLAWFGERHGQTCSRDPRVCHQRPVLG